MDIILYGERKPIPKKYLIRGVTSGLVNLTKSAANYLKHEYPNYYKHQYLPMQEPYNDESIMPIGKFKGDKLEDVPDWHFLWLEKQTWINDYPRLNAYIKDNMESFQS